MTVWPIPPLYRYSLLSFLRIQFDAHICRSSEGLVRDTEENRERKTRVADLAIRIVVNITNTLCFLHNHTVLILHSVN